MLTDAYLQLSSSQAVTSTAVSTNTLDLQSTRDIGEGTPLYVVITVDEAAAASGSATVQFQLIVSANADLSSADVLIETAALGKAELTAGHKPIVLPIPPSILTAQPIGKRYFGVNYVVATGPLTAGKFSATVTDASVSVGKSYASGFSVY